jgi:hypothetical protein
MASTSPVVMPHPFLQTNEKKPVSLNSSLLILLILQNNYCDIKNKTYKENMDNKLSSTFVFFKRWNITRT